MLMNLGEAPLPVPSLPPSRKLKIPGGDEGTRQTLRLMRALVLHGKQQPEIRAQALSLVSDLLQKDYRTEAERVHAFVRDQIRYTRDVAGVETLHTAPQILRQRQGDCDDKTVLIGSLLQAIGHRVRLVAIGYGRAFSHVYPEVNVRGTWIGMESTENWAFGVVPPNPTRRMEQEV